MAKDADDFIPTRQSLLTRLKSWDDQESWREFFDTYWNLIYGLALKSGLTEAEAQDAVQETLLRAWKYRRSLQDPGSLRAWLHRIATNTAIGMKRKHRRVLQLSSGLETGTVNEPADPSEATQPGRALEMAEDERRIQQALSRLSPEHRTVLVLKDMEGRKYEDMAELLEVPIGTIRSRLHRARLELRDILLKDEDKVEKA